MAVAKVNKISPKLLIIFFLLVAAALVQLAVIAWKLEDIKSTEPSNKSPTIKKEAFNKAKYSVSDPASPWVVVNKGRILQAQYVPADLTTPNVTLRFNASSPAMKLRRDAATVLEKMFGEATKQGVRLRLSSGYRSYDTQAGVYASMVRAYGQAQADKESARAGHSEHQTGWAADVGRPDGRCEFQACFGDTIEGEWLARNAYKYGFIIRYPKGKENLTGYAYEPWHLRFIGTALANEINQTGQTLEQFFGLPTATTYTTQPHRLKTSS